MPVTRLAGPFGKWTTSQSSLILSRMPGMPARTVGKMATLPADQAPAGPPTVLRKVVAAAWEHVQLAFDHAEVEERLVEVLVREVGLLREGDHVAGDLVLLEGHDGVVAGADDVWQGAGRELGEELLVVLALGRGEVHLHLVLGVLLGVGLEERVPELLLGDATRGVGHHDLDRAGRGV